MLLKINHFIPNRMALTKKWTITSIDKDVVKQEPGRKRAAVTEKSNGHSVPMWPGHSASAQKLIYRCSQQRGSEPTRITLSVH